ncbi:uncharacterized protein LOC131456969 [Solea solea]|uniref:uncharacterized protein LOC131456969 n=1 Tax=Solea solea TaxID=90069 RepID=UPI00272D4CD8|nr:uncharacterized protein LOC131456969 [Solea solea]
MIPALPAQRAGVRPGVRPGECRGLTVSSQRSRVTSPCLKAWQKQTGREYTQLNGIREAFAIKKDFRHVPPVKLGLVDIDQRLKNGAFWQRLQASEIPVGSSSRAEPETGSQSSIINQPLSDNAPSFPPQFSYIHRVTSAGEDFNFTLRWGAERTRHLNTGIFQQSTEDVTLKYTTPITPAQWTLFVWDFMYFWLFSMFIYFVVGLCRRTAYDWLYTMPAVLPYGFHASLIISICFNIAWLFLFDRELLRAQLIISALMTFANYTILFFSCHGLKIYAAWLHKYHNVDLWLIRILVQNGVAVYATWGTVSTLLNLTIYLQHQRGTSRCDCAMLSLMLLLMELFAWFLLENFYLDEHVRYIVTIYPVVILWLSGILDNSTSPKSPMYIFAALILAISCMMFAVRIALITWRHRKQPLYKDSGLSMSPVEIALTQRKIFL